MKKLLTLLTALVATVNVAQAVEIEKLKTIVTDQALYAQQKELETVNIMLSFNAGTVFEDNYAHGTANLFANIITAGTKTRTNKQIQDELEMLGSDIYVYSSRDELRFEITSLAENIEPTLVILEDILKNSVFPEKELTILKSTIKQAIKQQQESPGFNAIHNARKQFYGEENIKAYVSNLGTLKTVDTITREDLINFYKDYITKENMRLSVVSSLPKEEISKLMDTYLIAINKGPRKLLIKPTVVNETNWETVSKDLKQTTIMLYGHGLSYDDERYYVSEVFNYILGGGGFSSRLMESLREKKGLTYGVSSGFEYILPYEGLYMINTQTSNANKYKAESLIRKELGELLNNGITKQELDNAKKFLIGSFPNRIRTNDKLLAHLNIIQKFNLGMDYLDKWSENIQKVELEQVNELSKEVIKSEVDMSRVFVGGI